MLVPSQGSVSRKTSLLEKFAQAVAVEARDHRTTRNHQRPLEQVRLLRHQLERVGGGKRFAAQAHRLEGGAFGVDIIARVGARKERLQFVKRERLFGIVALIEFDTEFVAQETPGVAAGASGRFPDEAGLLHVSIPCATMAAVIPIDRPITRYWCSATVQTCATNVPPHFHRLDPHRCRSDECRR